MLKRAAATLLALSFPLAILGLGVRAAMSHAFLGFEYARPGFPADTYGFTAEDRMLYGSYGLDYLSNGASPRFLGELRFPAGEPVFTPGEVAHMADVKQVMGAGLSLAGWLLAVVVVAGLSLAVRHRRLLASGLRWGVVLTIMGLAALVASAALDWERFFTWVHSLFFSAGTWTFYRSDTLIRLYPEQFWVDASILIGAVVAGLCALALILARRAARSAR